MALASTVIRSTCARARLEQVDTLAEPVTRPPVMRRSSWRPLLSIPHARTGAVDDVTVEVDGDPGCADDEARRRAVDEVGVEADVGGDHRATAQRRGLARRGGDGDVAGSPTAATNVATPTRRSRGRPASAPPIEAQMLQLRGLASHSRSMNSWPLLCRRSLHTSDRMSRSSVTAASSRTELTQHSRVTRLGGAQLRHHCPILEASELLAERWTIIILRNIVILDAGTSTRSRLLPSLSRGLLSKRLRDLERAGCSRSAPSPTGQARSTSRPKQARRCVRIMVALSTGARSGPT